MEYRKIIFAVTTVVGVMACVTAWAGEIDKPIERHHTVFFDGMPDDTYVARTNISTVAKILDLSEKPYFLKVSTFMDRGLSSVSFDIVSEDSKEKLVQHIYNSFFNPASEDHACFTKNDYAYLSANHRNSSAVESEKFAYDKHFFSKSSKRNRKKKISYEVLHLIIREEDCNKSGLVFREFTINPQEQGFIVTSNMNGN